MKKVFLHGKLGSGKFVVVDDEDYQRVYKAKPYMGTKYVYVTINHKSVPLHDFIYGVHDKSLVIDHIDRDKMNNSKSNYRLVTVSENNKNRTLWSKK